MFFLLFIISIISNKKSKMTYNLEERKTAFLKDYHTIIKGMLYKKFDDNEGEANDNDFMLFNTYFEMRDVIIPRMCKNTFVRKMVEWETVQKPMMLKYIDDDYESDGEEDLNMRCDPCSYVDFIHELSCEFRRLTDIHEKHLNNIKPSLLSIPIRRFLKELDSR